MGADILRQRDIHTYRQTEKFPGAPRCKRKHGISSVCEGRHCDPADVQCSFKGEFKPIEKLMEIKTGIPGVECVSTFAHTEM